MIETEPIRKRRGRRAPLSPARQRLAARYLPLARAMSKPLKANWPGAWDDFESAACMALVEAAESYDPSRNVRFSTFARFRIWGALRDVQRELIALGYRWDFEDGPEIDAGGMPVHCERHGRVIGIEEFPPVGSDLEGKEAIEKLLKKLPARYAKVCHLLYVQGKSGTEAAEALGCSQSQLSYMHRKALELLNDSWCTSPQGGDGASA